MSSERKAFLGGSPRLVGPTGVFYFQGEIVLFPPDVRRSPCLRDGIGVRVTRGEAVPRGKEGKGKGKKQKKKKLKRHVSSSTV